MRGDDGSFFLPNVLDQRRYTMKNKADTIPLSHNAQKSIFLPCILVEWSHNEIESVEQNCPVIWNTQQLPSLIIVITVSLLDWHSATERPKCVCSETDFKCLNFCTSCKIFIFFRAWKPGAKPKSLW